MSDISISVTTGPSISIDAGVDETTLINTGPSIAAHGASHISGGSDAINHNNLSGIQGGNSSERYHLTKTQYDSLGGDGSFDFVSLTGDETISGIKTFSSQFTYFNNDGFSEGFIFAGGDPNYQFGLYSEDRALIEITGDGSYIISYADGALKFDDDTEIATFTQRPTVNGTGILLGGEAVLLTSNQTISGTKSFASTIKNIANNNNPSTATSFIGGGQNNSATATNSFIGGGQFNTATAASTAIAGGASNNASSLYASIGGGQSNIASQTAASVGGGEQNNVFISYSNIGGGFSNKILSPGQYTVIAGGIGNTTSGLASNINGGQLNSISSNGFYSTIGGGSTNRIFQDYSAIAGGRDHISSGSNSFIAGGRRGRIPSSDAGASVLADGQNRDHISSGAHTLTLDYANGVYVPTGAIYTNERIFVNGTGVLLSGEVEAHDTGYLTGYATQDYVTGASGHLQGQITTLNNATGSYALASETGNFVTTSQTGQFYASNNPSGFITGVDLSNYVTASATGELTGEFYPRNNPSGFITGVDLSSYATQNYVTGISGDLQTQITTLNNATGSYVLDTETGDFITTSQTGQFYASNNPSGFITGVDLSSYATQNYVTGISGDLQTQITTLNNATGSYVLDTETGNFVTTSQTGGFLTTGAADLRYVDLTSSQTISGQKTFEHELSVKELLTVETTGSLNIVADTYSESAGSIIRTRRARGSIESPSAVLDSDVIGNFSFAAHNGTEFPSTASAAIKAKAYGDQTSTNNAAYLSFETKTSGVGGQLLERVVISDDGMVGINNSSPSTQLYVQGSGTISNVSESFVPKLFIDGYGQNNSFRQRRAGGSFASMSAISSGTALGNNQFFGATGNSFNNQNSAAIAALADGNFSNTSAPARIEFRTTPVGSVATSTTRMTIASDGNVGIGTDIPTEKLTVVGNISASGYNNLPCEFIVACSDETTDLTTGLATTFRAPYAFNFTGARASVAAAPSGSTIIVDINNELNSMLSTKLSIDATEKTSTTAATPPVIDATYANVSDDAEITIDIDQIGATTAGAGLKVTLYGVRA